MTDRDYIGIIFPYSLLTASKTFWVGLSGFVMRVEGWGLRAV